MAIEINSVSRSTLLMLPNNMLRVLRGGIVD